MKAVTEDQIAQRLASLQASRIEEARFKPSAVLLPLFEKEGQLHVLFTRRTTKVATHKGQISFPGGRIDAEDKDELDAALRETQEELGIEPGEVRLLGRLDDIATITYFRISPFVGWIPYPYQFKVSQEEIAEVIELPVESFLDPGIVRVEQTSKLDGKIYPVYFFDVGGYTVWGATARIFKQFLEAVYGWREPG